MKYRSLVLAVSLLGALAAFQGSALASEIDVTTYSFSEVTNFEVMDVAPDGTATCLVSYLSLPAQQLLDVRLTQLIDNTGQGADGYIVQAVVKNLRPPKPTDSFHERTQELVYRKLPLKHKFFLVRPTVVPLP